MSTPPVATPVETPGQTRGAADKWTEYWKNEGASGEVFVNAEGQKHPHLSGYWQTQFSGLATNARIIDLAAGAGSIFTHLPTHHDYELFASDLSIAALKILKQRLPQARVIAASADSLPLHSQTFDLVVSQFGVEYAGDRAFAAAADLVRDHGRLALLCHYRDGYIDARNKGQLESACEVVETGFIDKGIAMVEAVFKGEQQAFIAAQLDFVPAEKIISTAATTYRQGVHSHLYQGFRQLFANRQQYDATDITGWLEAMKEDVDRNIIRLTEMRKAASSEPKIRQICRELTQAGLRKVGYSPFSIPGSELPVAWSITAERP